MLNKNEVLSRIMQSGLVAVVRADSAEQADKITDACITGGVAAIEITFTVPGVVDVIKALAAKMVKLCNRYKIACMPGAMTIKEVIEAMEAGADIVKIFPGELYRKN